MTHDELDAVTAAIVGILYLKGDYERRVMEWPTTSEWIIVILCCLAFSLIAGFIDATCEQRKRRKEQEERERLQRE